MLEVLTGSGIRNIAVVVTRYFGGTLLGTGGLVRAYTQAVKEGLDHCETGIMRKGCELEVTTDYNAKSFHSLCSYWGRRSSSRFRTCLASPMMWWSVWTFLLISARSMSIWTILA